MIQVGAKDISFGFVPETGLLDGFTSVDENREIAPLHCALWVGTNEVMPADAAPLMERLGGDFFCAPFVGRESESHLHGWPPNSPWRVAASDVGELVAELMRPVFGATLSKRMSVRDGHPFVYQVHSFQRGKG